MMMEKHNSQIVFVIWTTMGKIANIRKMLKDHMFIKDLQSNCFKPFIWHVESANCCGTCTTVNIVKVLHITYLRETNAAIQTRYTCNCHPITISYVVYHIMKKRFKRILEVQMENMNLTTQVETFRIIKNWECFANNRYIITSFHLPNINRKRGEAEHQVKSILKNIQRNNKLTESHSRNFIIRWSPSTKYALLVIIVLWHAAKASSSDQVIQWKLMTKPVYFGKSVILECSIHTEDKSAPMLWTKLPNGKTLAVNKNSRYNEKYAVTVEYHERKMIYNLTIKHFNSTDVNQMYKCDCGFHSYSDNLLLNKNDFISEPSVEHIKNFSLSNRKLNGIVMVHNGYPKPLCSGKFEGEEISKFMKINIQNISIFYETKIELDYRTNMCTGTVNVTCSYGNYTVMITQLVDACIDSSKTSNTTVTVLIIIATLAGCMLVGCGLAVYSYRKWKQNRLPIPSAPECLPLQPE